MTLRDRLIELFRTMPEENLRVVERMVVDVVRSAPRFSMTETLERADAFRVSPEISEKLPDVVDLIHDMRGERLDDIR